jgi:hypothetical protein
MVGGVRVVAAEVDTAHHPVIVKNVTKNIVHPDAVFRQAGRRYYLMPFFNTPINSVTINRVPLNRVDNQHTP